MGNKRIKPPLINKGSKISVTEAQLKVLEFDYPIFCFKHLHPKHNLDQCDKDEKSALVEQLAKLSQLSWVQVQMADRHGLGSEKISRSSIKSSIPASITDDVQDFLAFRFSGKKPFIGFRNQFILHIVYIDKSFSVYDH